MQYMYCIYCTTVTYLKNWCNAVYIALRYTTTEGQWKDSALRLTNALVNIRAIVNHFSPKVESWTVSQQLPSLTEQQVGRFFNTQIVLRFWLILGVWLIGGGVLALHVFEIILNSLNDPYSVIHNFNLYFGYLIFVIFLFMYF